MTPARERVALTALLLAWVGAVVGLSATMGTVARMAPLAVGIPTLVLVALELAGDLKRARQEDARMTSLAGTAQTPGAIAWLVGLAGVVAIVGVPIGVPAWLLLFLRLRAREPWRVAGAYAGTLALVVWGVVVSLMGVPLDGGAVTRWGS